MSDWQERLQVGVCHEARVEDALARRGWAVQRTGQGTWNAEICAALHTTRSSLRFFPDLLASRCREVFAIDAKDRMPTTKSVRYTISRDALEADLKLLPAIFPIQIFYVFGDLTVHPHRSPRLPHHRRTAPRRRLLLRRSTPRPPLRRNLRIHRADQRLTPQNVTQPPRDLDWATSSTSRRKGGRYARQPMNPYQPSHRSTAERHTRRT